MAKLRVLFFLVSLVVWATKVDVPVFAQVQTTNKKAQDMAGIEKLRQQDIAATLSRGPVALTDLWTMTLCASARASRRRLANKLSERATNAGPLAQGSRC